jgi:hypothetical protein
LLLENGADVNADDGDALKVASLYGHKEVVKILNNFYPMLKYKVNLSP